MPRSPSRDLVDRFTGNRDYFHRADPLRRWKNGVSLAAIGIVLGWLVVELVMPGRAISAHSHGELAGPHAAFETNCEACHKGHSAGDFLANPASVFSTHSRWHDLTCTKCHAGPAHHASVKDGGAFNDQCSNCHHDHQGRGHFLTRMDDSHCTKCHADLPAAHVAGKTEFAATITGFTRDHPEFKPLASGKAESERRLKFSHALHMTPGLVYDANDRHLWTPEELSKTFGMASRYTSADGDPKHPVQLNCNSCHQLDAGRVGPSDHDHAKFDRLENAILGLPRQSLLPARAEGAYYLPVNFELHCKACHPLRTPTAASNGKVVADLPVPHREQPDALRKILRGQYAARLSKDKNPDLFVPPGPGSRLNAHEHPGVVAFGAEVDRLADAALKSLLLNLAPPAAVGAPIPSGGFACGKCHYSSGPGQTDVALLPDRSIWFEHAKFNHVSHRGLKCADCHPGTEGAFAPGGAVNEREPALLVGIKTCQACHAAAGTSVALPNGMQADAAGIRHSCTDCHRYHNGDRPLQGMGSPKRDPADPLNLADWVKGGPRR